MTPAIEIDGLTKRFGSFVAVDNLSLTVPAGSVFGFLGANGAGKTTTIRAIAGLTHPSAGSIKVVGVKPNAGAAYRRQLGYLCQEPAFYGWMTGREVLRYAAGYFPELGKPAQRIDSLMDLVGLHDSAGKRVAGYSGGMRQRLGIAAALVGEPAVVVLDEPASGLDPLGRKDVLDLIETLRDRTTIFYSTHILDDVQRVSDRVAVLDHGRLLATDRTADLLASFTENRLLVRLFGATAETATALAAIAGVTSVTVGDVRPDGTFAFTVRFQNDADVAWIQRAITALASGTGLTVVEARPLVLDLEEVFLRLVGEAQDKNGKAA